MSTYHHHERIDTPVAATEAVVTSRRISPGQVIGGLAGAVLAVLGVVVVTRTGVDSTLNQPVTDILGTKQSVYVGGFELIVGLLIVAASTSITTRGVLGFLGTLTIVAGVVVAAASGRILLDIGATRSAGTIGIVLGAVTLLGALLPSFVRTERAVDTR